MLKLRISKPWIAALFSLCVLTIAIANVEVVAQPYERSAVLNAAIHFERVDFEFIDAQQTSKQHTIYYAAAGDKTKAGVLFVHGTPGGWGAFERYLENPQLQQDFFMVSVDRMGWGDSPLAPKEIDGDFELQSQSMKAVMAQYPQKKWTIVGHSLGASIAPKLALDAPDSVDSLLLLAGSLKPSLGNPRWYNWAANTWLVSQLIGKTMRWSNREIMGLRRELKQLDAEIKSAQIDAHLSIMQGAKDKLVSPKNPAYVEREWAQSFTNIELIELSDEGHFLPWRQTPLVIETIYSLRSVRNNLAAD